MAAFLVDEDLPRNLASELRAAGIDAIDIRDVNLGGSLDAAVFEYAVKSHRVIVTGDLDFSNVLTYPLSSHRGIAVARLPGELSVALTNKRIVDAITGLAGEELTAALVIIEPDRVRVRRTV